VRHDKIKDNIAAQNTLVTFTSTLKDFHFVPKNGTILFNFHVQIIDDYGAVNGLMSITTDDLCRI
jgi:hypothetical protein